MGVEKIKSAQKNRCRIINKLQLSGKKERRILKFFALLFYIKLLFFLPRSLFCRRAFVNKLRRDKRNYF